MEVERKLVPSVWPTFYTSRIRFQSASIFQTLDFNLNIIPTRFYPASLGSSNNAATVSFRLAKML